MQIRHAYKAYTYGIDIRLTCTQYHIQYGTHVRHTQTLYSLIVSASRKEAAGGAGGGNEANVRQQQRAGDLAV